MAERARRSFVEEVPQLLEERGMSMRELARHADVDPGFLWRILRRRQYKTVSTDVARRIALAFGLPEDYFAEYREGIVIDEVKRNSALRDRLYSELRGRRS